MLSATDRMPFPERNRCLILMAFIHGFRASELLGLRLSDIDLAGMWGDNQFWIVRSRLENPASLE
ncbi:hypothetical protein HUH83_000801 [Salmonella enterica]|nr:hypothetical protein [Salmonella enterica]